MKDTYVVSLVSLDQVCMYVSYHSSSSAEKIRQFFPFSCGLSWRCDQQRRRTINIKYLSIYGAGCYKDYQVLIKGNLTRGRKNPTRPNLEYPLGWGAACPALKRFRDMRHNDQYHGLYLDVLVCALCCKHTPPTGGVVAHLFLDVYQSAKIVSLSFA